MGKHGQVPQPFWPLLVLVMAELALGASGVAGAGNLGRTSAGKASFEAAVEVFKIDSTIWRSYKASTGQLYFHNAGSGETTWEDPRKVAAQEESRLAAFILFMSPFLGILLVGGAYITYLMVKHPDRLKGPTKKARQQQQGRSSDSSSRAKAQANAAGREYGAHEQAPERSPGRSSTNGTPHKLY